MQKSISGKLFSASDLVNFAACMHLTHLDLINLETPLVKAVDTDEMALIQGKGFEHEGRYLELLKSQCGGITDLTVRTSALRLHLPILVRRLPPGPRSCFRQHS